MAPRRTTVCRPLGAIGLPQIEPFVIYPDPYPAVVSVKVQPLLVSKSELKLVGVDVAAVAIPPLTTPSSCRPASVIGQ